MKCGDFVQLRNKLMSKHLALEQKIHRTYLVEELAVEIRPHLTCQLDTLSVFTLVGHFRATLAVIQVSKFYYSFIPGMHAVV